MKRIILILILLVSVVSGQQTYDQFITALTNGKKYVSNPIIIHQAVTWKARQVHYPIQIDNPWQPDSLLIYYGGGDYTLNNFNIGMASAPKTNPLAWTEYASNPLLTFPTSGGLPQAVQAVGPHLVYFDSDSNKVFIHATCFNTGATSSWQGRWSSTDGKAFTYLGAVLQASGDETVLGDAGYLRDGNTWYCYYTYRTATTVLPGIRLATSTDCVNWTKPGTQILSVGESYDSRYIEGCQALKRGNTFILLYSCYNGTTASNGKWVSAIATSDSPNTAFTKYSGNPVLTASSNTPDANHVATSYIYGDYLFYQGTANTGDYNQALWDMFVLYMPTVINTPIDTPDNVKYFVSKMVYHTSITESTQNFLHAWKIPRTGNIASNCDSANDIMTFYRNGNRVPHVVKFYPDTITVYVNAPISTVSDSTYFIGFGKELAEADSVRTFTASGISNAWLFDESSGLTANDAVGTLHNTIVSPDTSGGAVNKFGKSLRCVPNGRAAASGQPLSGATSYTYSAWVYRSTSPLHIIFTNRTAATPHMQIYLSSISDLVAYFGPTLITYNELNIFPTGAWFNITVTYNGAGATNADRAKLYVNGVLKTVNFSGTIPTSIPTFTGGYVSNGCDNNAGTPYTITGYMDNSLLYVGSTKTAGYIKDQYLMNSNINFYTTGAVTSTTLSSATESRFNSYKAAFKSAYRKAWK